MATITVTIGNSLSDSLSIGDTTYHVRLTSSGGFSTDLSSIVELEM